MKFTPKTEAELAEEGLFPAGTYDFDILEAEDTYSKASGKDMIKLKLKVYGPNGRTQQVWDYIGEWALYKVSNLCKAIGLKDEYDAGELKAADMEGRSAKVKLAVEPAGEWPAKNTAKDYLPAVSPASEPAPRAKVTANIDDEIPF